MEKRVFCDISFWFALGDAGLDVDEISKLIVEVPKSTEIVDIIVEKEKKVFVFTNNGSHIDCRIVGVRTVTIYRLLK